MPDLATINYGLGLTTIALQILTASLLVLYVLRKRPAFVENAAWISQWGLWIGFLASAAFSIPFPF